MKLGKFKMWTKEEDDTLIKSFNKHKEELGARWRGSVRVKIKNDLELAGFHRTIIGVAQRCYRLKLILFEVKGGMKNMKCADCDRIFETHERYIYRTKNKKIYCSKCMELHRYDWDGKHPQEVKKYHREYGKIYMRTYRKNKEKK